MATLGTIEVQVDTESLRTITGMMETMAGVIADLQTRVQELEREAEYRRTLDLEASEME
jgi:hypothetical protein